MARGGSGRIVVDIEPDLKRRLHSALAMDGSTLKDWFIQCAQSYLQDKALGSSEQEPRREEEDEF